jgi:hypothetical protein
MWDIIGINSFCIPRKTRVEGILLQFTKARDQNLAPTIGWTLLILVDPRYLDTTLVEPNQMIPDLHGRTHCLEFEHLLHNRCPSHALNVEGLSSPSYSVVLLALDRWPTTNNIGNRLISAQISYVKTSWTRATFDCCVGDAS